MAGTCMCLLRLHEFCQVQALKQQLLRGRLFLPHSSQRQHHGAIHCVIGVAGSVQGSTRRLREPSWQPLLSLPTNEGIDARTVNGVCCGASLRLLHCSLRAALQEGLQVCGDRHMDPRMCCKVRVCLGTVHLALTVARQGRDGKVSSTGIHRRLPDSGSYPLPLGRKIVQRASPGQPLQWMGTSTMPGRAVAHHAVATNGHRSLGRSKSTK